MIDLKDAIGYEIVISEWLKRHLVDTDTPLFEDINYSISYLEIIGFDLARKSNYTKIRIR